MPSPDASLMAAIDKAWRELEDASQACWAARCQGNASQAMIHANESTAYAHRLRLLTETWANEKETDRAGY